MNNNNKVQLHEKNLKITSEIRCVLLISFKALIELSDTEVKKAKEKLWYILWSRKFSLEILNTIKSLFKQMSYWWKLCRLLISYGSIKSLWLSFSSTLNRFYFQTRIKKKNLSMPLLAWGLLLAKLQRVKCDCPINP